MRKLKKSSNGKVYDCNIILNGRDLMAVYWDGFSWKAELLFNFEPAIPGNDY